MGGMCSKSNDVGEDLDTSRHHIAIASLKNSTTKKKTPATSTIAETAETATSN
jgi:hypothetical protein